jgi:hypothetical protein
MFYFFGGLTIAWFVAWMLLVFNKPSEHPFISAGEKDFINSALVHADQEKVGAYNKCIGLWMKLCWSIFLIRPYSDNFESR